MTSQDDQMRVILLEAGLNTRQRGRTVMARSIVLLVLKFIKVENHLLLSMAVEDIAQPQFHASNESCVLLQ
jgi:hypothetical protein